MPYTMEQFQEEFKKRYLASLSDEEKLEGIPIEKRLEGIPTEKLLEGIPIKKLLKGIPIEKILEIIPFQERFPGLTKEQIRELVRSYLDDDQSDQPN